MLRFFHYVRPLTLALVCWLLVLLVPATQTKFSEAWGGRLSTAKETGEIFDTWIPDYKVNAKSFLRRFPESKPVQIYAAQSDEGTSQLLKRYPNDSLILVLAMREQVASLLSDRNEGPLTNPNYPAAPPKTSELGIVLGSSDKGNRRPSREDWNRFIELAKCGQRLEPNNTFFTWLELYALCATRRDDEARALLAKAALQTEYDDHGRDQVLNNLAVLRLVYGSPISPRDLTGAMDTLGGRSEMSRFRQTCRWLMEGVIADRQRGQHTRALKTATDLMLLSRVMRREGYSLIESLVGNSCEAIALGSVTIPTKAAAATRRGRWQASLAAFQNDPTMLYSYAKSQNRVDIQRRLDREWIEIGKWNQLSKVIVDQNWTGNSSTSTLAIVASERFAALTLKALPFTIILTIVFTLLSLCFPEQTGARSSLLPGVCLGISFLLLGMICDAVIAWQNPDPIMGDEFEWSYVGGLGLLSAMPSWVYYGMASAMFCLGLNRAVAWQKEQAGQQISLRSRIKTIFAPPEDGLARFDFGWILGLAARYTCWLLLLGGIGWACYNSGDADKPLLGDTLDDLFDPVLFLMLLAILPSVLLSIVAWRRRPRRRETLQLSLRLSSDALIGLFVVISVSYALVAFGVLPFALQYERTFQRAMERGEVAIARAKLGL